MSSKHARFIYSIAVLSLGIVLLGKILEKVQVPELFYEKLSLSLLE